MAGSVRAGTVKGGEVAKFDALAATWWDRRGPMRALHSMNPLRTGWIVARLPPGCRLLDIGCGGGIAAEAFARLGFAVTGIDAAPAPVAVARAHARSLPIDYRVTTAEALADAGETFDAVCALEVIEHTPDPAAFVALLARLLTPAAAVRLHDRVARTPTNRNLLGKHNPVKGSLPVRLGLFAKRAYSFQAFKCKSDNFITSRAVVGAFSVGPTCISRFDKTSLKTAAGHAGQLSSIFNG